MDKKLLEAIIDVFKSIVVLIRPQPLDGIYSDIFTWPLAADVSPVKVEASLGGKASHIRLFSTQIARLRFTGLKNQRSVDWADGLLALVDLNLEDMDISEIEVIPAAYPCTLSVVATR